MLDRFILPKKGVVALIFYLILAVSSYGQSYGWRTVAGTSDPYVYNNPGTSVLAIPSDNVLSSEQTIPFEWNFFGSPVSTYKVSDNGYITFDSDASISSPTNTVIPSAGGPNNAIYAFWDDLNIVAGSGSVDEVRTHTYGASPNRTHVIQWYSASPVAGSGFLYAAIRLYECGDFDVVLNYSTATGMTATIGCEDATGTNGLMIEGPSFGFPALQATGADDIVYSFHSDGIYYDAAIVSSDIGRYVNIGENKILGKFMNYGAETITSYDLNYTIDGGEVVKESIRGVNIAAFGGASNYSHSTPLNIANGGEEHEVCIWIDNINGNADERTYNDRICKSIFSNNGTGAERVNVVIEEFTGSWCGWCPDGDAIVEELIATNNGRVIGMTIHDADPMEYKEGIRSEFGVSSYPNAMIDRKVFSGEPDEPHSRSQWTSNVNTQLTRYTPVEVEVNHLYDPATRTITATITANFVDYAAGDMRFSMAIIEDHVTGTETGFNQMNYQTESSNGTFTRTTDSIVGYSHRNVLRANEPGPLGNKSVIPSVVEPGSKYSETFTYVLPMEYDENEISVIGLVSYANTGVIGEREILNADQKHLSNVSLDQTSLIGTLTVPSTPVEDKFTLELDLRQATSAEIILYNPSGQQVSSLDSGDYSAGLQKVKARIVDLIPGVYYVSVRTENDALTERVIVK